MTETGAGCSADDCDAGDDGLSCDVSTQTVEEKLGSQPVEHHLERVGTLEKQLKVKNEQIMKQKFRLANCERSELSGLFNARIFYIYQAIRHAVNVLNVSTCI